MVVAAVGNGTRTKRPPPHHPSSLISPMPHQFQNLKNTKIMVLLISLMRIYFNFHPEIEGPVLPWPQTFVARVRVWSHRRKMEAEVDHYLVLGLPSGEEGANLTEKEITKAYRSKARELHPDKRPDDPNAASNFQKLSASYDILKDEKARKLFDDLLRVKRDNQRRQSQRDGKRRKMVSELERREREAFAADPSAKEREEEERIARQLREEIARIRAMHAPSVPKPKAEPKKESGGGGGIGLDEEKVLKVSWEKVGEDYSADRLRELFSKFGEVEDVVIKGNKKKGSALVVMATKQGAVATTGSVIGHLANPLLVLPLKPAMAAVSSSAPKSVVPDKINNLVGAGYHAFEDSVLKKLQKAAEKQR